MTDISKALSKIEKLKEPEVKAIVERMTFLTKENESLRKKDIAVLGQDEAFILEDSAGQIKAFKKALTLSEENGGLVQPTYKGPHVISAQGYEMWAESTGASVIFPKEVLVGDKWCPNPYAERDPQNRRILAVHARAIAFRYSSMGIPQVSDWTTIFDTPSYRMIDLLAKAKQQPQCFKVLPKEMKPEQSEKKKETWASYPFDESMDLWIDTSHPEVITWLSQILNREKKAMDFAQTFARRNALKHLSGLQKAPKSVWKLAVLAWRPIGNNIIQWSSAQYAELQDRVKGMITGNTDEFKGQIEMQQGSVRTSEDEDAEVIEMEADPESAKEPPKDKKPAQDPSKAVKQAMFLAENFTQEFQDAVLSLNNDPGPIEQWDDKTAEAVCQKVDELVNERG